jgi:hypothetical protein
MKQLTTTKHIIFVILLLVIILSLFRGNIIEGYRRRNRSSNLGNVLAVCKDIKKSKDCNKVGECEWRHNKCRDHECRNPKNVTDCINYKNKKGELLNCKWDGYRCGRPNR